MKLKELKRIKNIHSLKYLEFLNIPESTKNIIKILMKSKLSICLYFSKIKKINVRLKKRFYLFSFSLSCMSIHIANNKDWKEAIDKNIYFNKVSV